MKLSKFAALATSAIISTQAMAANGVQLYTPVVNESGILNLHSSSFGESSVLGVGLNYNLAVDPVEVPDSKGGMKNYFHSFNIGVGSKVIDNLHLFADASGHYLSPLSDDMDAIPDVDSEFVLGNVKLGASYAIINNAEGGFGLGITPHVVLPVGGKNPLLDGPRNTDGDRTWHYGATLAIDYRTLHSDLVLMNIGWERAEKIDTLTWGVGYQTALADNERHNLLVEIRGAVNIDDPKVAGSDPVEADIAYKGYSENRLCSYVAGLGRGFNREAAGAPDLRVFLGVNWQLDHVHGPKRTGVE